MQVKNYLVIIICFLFLSLRGFVSAQQINAYLTNADLTEKLSPVYIQFGEQPSVSDIIYTIDPSVKYQTIEGFGAALTGSSAVVLNYLNDDKKNELLKNIFDPYSGAGFNYVRISLGASDFSLYNWTHTNDDEKSFEFKDPEGVIPILLTVKSINPELRIMASPWSPPVYMKKDHQSLIGGYFNPLMGEDLADYLITFINEMKSRELNLDAITIQNEPLYNTADYMCMYMSAEQQRDFIRNHFGLKLYQNNLAENLSTKLYVYDHNWDNAYNYVSTIKKDKNAWDYVSGTAFHAYRGNVNEQSRVKYLDRSKDIILTEITGHSTPDGTPDDFRWAMNNTVLGNLLNYGSGLIYWNLALDTDWKAGVFGPVVPGGPVNCRGIIDINEVSKDIRYNVEFYAIAHACKVIRPGAKRIESGYSDRNKIKQAAFINPDNSRAMIIFNTGNSDKDISVRDGDKNINLTVKAQNVISLKWPEPDPGKSVENDSEESDITPIS